MVNLNERGPSEKYRRPASSLIYNQNMMKTYFENVNVDDNMWMSSLLLALLTLVYWHWSVERSS